MEGGDTYYPFPAPSGPLYHPSQAGVGRVWGWGWADWANPTQAKRGGLGDPRSSQVVTTPFLLGFGSGTVMNDAAASCWFNYLFIFFGGCAEAQWHAGGDCVFKRPVSSYPL